MWGAVFHEATVASVPESIEDLVVADEVNANGTMNLPKASPNSGIKRFVHALSCMVYGEMKCLLISEESHTLSCLLMEPPS